MRTRGVIEKALAEIEAGDWPAECIEWPAGRTPFGHGVCRRDGEHIASRVVWRRVFGPIAEGLFVLHRCDNPPCVNPRHLFLGTKADNTADMMAKGRNVARVGQGNGRTKLTDTQIAEIHAAVAAGETHRAVAARYGIHSGYVSRICSGKRRAAV